MRCISCMQEIEDGAQICGFCEYPQDMPQEHSDSLQPGTELRNRFELGRELGRGGFGITYIGYDNYFEQKVAIKEYYPESLAARMPGEKKIYWRNVQQRESGCRNVIREAQKMNRIGEIAAAVHVLDVFYENNTAYIAMEYVDGITLKKHLLQQNRALTPLECYELMMPIVDTMIKFHEHGIIHRDISPDNIMIQRDMSPRILDLGAAKDVQMVSGNTVLVARNGFSPKEQYQTNGNIGTWTDVYALCATMYYSLTGRVPPPAMDRSETNDTLPFPGHLPEPIRLILYDGMRMAIENRIADMQELKKRLQQWHDGPVDQSSEDGKEPEGTAQPQQIPVSVKAEEKEVQKEEPVQPEPVVKPEQPAVNEKKESPRGRLAGWFPLFGKKKKEISPAQEPREPAVPKTVTVSAFGAPPMLRTDPNATILDDDITVLSEENVSAGVQAKAYLIHERTRKRIDITKCCFTLGRLIQTAANAADGMIEDNTRHVSRRHAAVLFDGTNFYLQDISGKNITQLNGVRIENGMMPENGGSFPSAYRLYDGDCIQLAVEKLVFHKGGRT